MHPSFMKDKYIKAKIIGVACENYGVTIQIGDSHYKNIHPGILIIKLPKFN